MHYSDTELIHILQETSTQNASFQAIEQQMKHDATLAQRVSALMNQWESEMDRWPAESLASLHTAPQFSNIFRPVSFAPTLPNPSFSPLKSNPSLAESYSPIVKRKGNGWMIGAVLFSGLFLLVPLIWIFELLLQSLQFNHQQMQQMTHSFQEISQGQNQLAQEVKGLKKQLFQEQASITQEIHVIKEHPVHIDPDLEWEEELFLKDQKQSKWVWKSLTKGQITIDFSQGRPDIFRQNKNLNLEIDLHEGKVESEGQLVGKIAYAKGLVPREDFSSIRKLSTLQKQIGSKVPIGTFMIFLGKEQELPEGWLVCDGREITSQNNQKLFNTLKNVYYTNTEKDPLLLKLPNFEGQMGQIFPHEDPKNGNGSQEYTFRVMIKSEE